MLKAGGEAKRRELVAMFGDLNIGDKSKMSQEEAKIAKDGDEEQSKFLTQQKANKQRK